MKLLAIFLFLFYQMPVMAQQINPADTIPVKILALTDRDKNNDVKFQAEARPLRRIAGAPEPFYTYFWEFGDGRFSFEKQPQHEYGDTGIYNVRVYATNNYDDGKPPPIKPKSIKVNNRQEMIASSAPGVFQKGENLSLKVNRMPRPEEEMVLIIAYRNKPGWNVNSLGGRIALFYNEKGYKRDNFKLEEIRNYHSEQSLDELGALQYAKSEIFVEDMKQRGSDGDMRKIPVESTSAASQIKQRQDFYRDKSYWSFDQLKSGEERFVFVSLVTTPEMLQDTNAVITLSAAFIPDDPSVQTELADLELQVVASHDPNKMMLRNRLMNYRFTGKKRKLNYKVRFQNTGEGPAKQITVTVNTPQVVDPSKLKITEMSPECVPCQDAYRGQSCIDTLIFKDSIRFVFKNIYLPGVRQGGVNDVDSTKGYVAYQLGFRKRPAKLPFSSNASIVFDKNDPIRTNRSTGRFKPGLSPGIIAMYGLQLSDAPTVKLGDKNFNLGFSVSPYAPHRKYLQAELYLSGYNEYSSPVTRLDGGMVTIDNQRYDSKYRDSFSTVSVVNLNLVPAGLRYNINRFIGVGAGPMIGLDLATTQKNISQFLISDPATQSDRLVEQSESETKSFTRFSASLFADLQVGLVRAGPAAGVRLFQSLDNKDRRLAFYMTWRL